MDYIYLHVLVVVDAKMSLVGLEDTVCFRTQIFQ